MVLVAPRSAKLVEAQGRAVHAAGRLRVRAARLPHDAAAVEGGHRLLAGRRSATRSSGIGVGFAGTPASHSLTGSVPVQRVGHGVGHRRPAARPRRRDHAVDLRRAADRRLRVGRWRRDRRAPASTVDHDNVQSRADQVVLERRRHRRAVPAVPRPDHRRRPSRRSSTGDTGPTPPASSRSCSARRSCSSCSPKRDDEQRLLAEYAREDAAAVPEVASGAT